MQEEVENKVVLIIQGTSRLTANVLKSAMTKALADMKQKHDKKVAKKEAKKEAAKAGGPHGQMTVKELAAKDRGLQSVEVSKDSIGSFNKIARKYGVDFAPYKVKGENTYLVFFKSPDGDAMNAAFEEYTRDTMKRSSRPSVLKALAHIRGGIKTPVKDKTRKKVPER